MWLVNADGLHYSLRDTLQIILSNTSNISEKKAGLQRSQLQAKLRYFHACKIRRGMAETTKP